MAPFAAQVPLFAEPAVRQEIRPDGTILLRAREQLGSYTFCMSEVFQAGVAAHPGRTLIAERDGTGWRRMTWGEAAQRVRGLAAGLLARGAAGRSVAILSGNGIEHLLLTLAAFTIGSPAVPVSVAYSLQSTDHQKLRRMMTIAAPAVVFAAAGAAFGPAIAAIREVDPTAAVVTLAGGQGSECLDDLESEAPGPDLARASAAVGPATVAKLLFTSGSTGSPKAVITTHRMLCANQQAISQVWPFLAEYPPVLLDWLPWSHTFGGSHNVGIVLARGGTLYVDDGRPTPGLFEATLRNLGDVAPTIYFNVPLGYSLLVRRLADDPVLARAFFRDLRVVFYAGSALPQILWDELRRLAAEHADHPVAVTTSWGLTETAPAATSTHFLSERSDCIGVPLPGVEIKLVPTAGKREIRVRGPNVTPGYHAREDLTAAAFDDEGYYRTGDAADLIDPGVPERGLCFQGRLAEDFKLSSGTWVNTAAVKASLLSACGGVLQDCVIAGHDGPFVAAMAWLNPAAAAQLTSGSHDDLAGEPRVRDHLARSLAALNRDAGSSRRIARLLLLAEPPQLDAGEITDKGYVNQRACLTRRAADVAVLYTDPPDSQVIMPWSRIP
jgi:feruloyl-CoA synthase